MPMRSAVVALLLLGAAPGDGSAYAAEVTLTLLDAPTVHVGPLALSSTSGSTDADVAGVNANGLVTAGEATSFATLDEETGEVHAEADIADIGIALAGLTGTIGAATATCDATPGGGTGVSRIANVRIPGLRVAASPAPNTAVDLAPAKIVFNEQSRNADGSLTVNAVHIYVHEGIGSGHVILAQARCGLAAPPVPLASGTGLWLGLGLLALVAIPAGVIAIRRRISANHVTPS